MNFSEVMFNEKYLTSDFHTIQYNTIQTLMALPEKGFSVIPIQTLLFQACLPTRQNGVENRDKAYYIQHISADK